MNVLVMDEKNITFGTSNHTQFFVYKLFIMSTSGLKTKKRMSVFSAAIVFL